MITCRFHIRRYPIIIYNRFVPNIFSDRNYDYDPIFYKRQIFIRFEREIKWSHNNNTVYYYYYYYYNDIDCVQKEKFVKTRRIKVALRVLVYLSAFVTVRQNMLLLFYYYYHRIDGNIFVQCQFHLCSHQLRSCISFYFTVFVRAVRKCTYILSEQRERNIFAPQVF